MVESMNVITRCCRWSFYLSSTRRLALSARTMQESIGTFIPPIFGETALDQMESMA